MCVNKFEVGMRGWWALPLELPPLGKTTMDAEMITAMVRNTRGSRAATNCSGARTQSQGMVNECGQWFGMVAGA